MDYYKDLYNKVGKRIGWDFSHIKKLEEGKSWNFFQEVTKKMKRGDVLLDIGTGGGEKILGVANKAKFIYGIDHSRSMITTARRNLKKSGYKNFKFLLMNSSKLEFPDNFFDVVTDRHCSFTATEVYRVLKNGGYFLTQQVSEGDQLNVKIAFRRGQAYGIKDGTLKEKYLSELDKVGFKNIDSFDYSSRIYYKMDNDYIFVLRFTPTIPMFGKEKKDFEILREFIQKNRTKKGIETNSKRFIIIAQK